jgi:hypothetical protein
LDSKPCALRSMAVSSSSRRTRLFSVDLGIANRLQNSICLELFQLWLGCCFCKYPRLNRHKNSLK